MSFLSAYRPRLTVSDKVTSIGVVYNNMTTDTRLLLCLAQDCLAGWRFVCFLWRHEPDWTERMKPDDRQLKDGFQD